MGGWEGPLANREARAMIVVVITGPIASGKSTLGRAVAVELAGRESDSAVVDLDLVYEMLDPSRGPKTDDARLREARRLARQIAAALCGLRSAVVVKGGVAIDGQRADVIHE